MFDANLFCLHQVADDTEAELNPYAYLARDTFTSEVFKIELQNLPNYCGVKVCTPVVIVWVVSCCHLNISIELQYQNLF